MREPKLWSALALAAVACLCLSAQTAPVTTAIVGSTVIDGTGDPPIADAVVLLSGARIASIGSRRAVSIPPSATEIDARGRWILPGLIDTNVHLSLYGGQNERYESLVRYQPRQAEIVLEAAQIDLAYGITTVRDSLTWKRTLIQLSGWHTSSPADRHAGDRLFPNRVHPRV